MKNVLGITKLLVQSTRMFSLFNDNVKGAKVLYKQILNWKLKEWINWWGL